MPGAATKPSLEQKAKKKAPPAAANTATLPINHAQFITLEDGSQVPVKIPPGMPAEQAQGILAFLKANPDAAKAAWAQAQAIMTNPGLAQAFINMGNSSSSGGSGAGGPDSARSAEVYAALKDDPELAHVFEDVKASGPSALQKYWDDVELMSKISAKLRDMRLAGGQAEAPGRLPAKGTGKPLSEAIRSLHDAAKWGDVEACERLLSEGADVNGPNERGISPLGVAVGFNQQAAASLLLDAGADLEARDAAGNTVLHYAAGYGRLELLKLLLARGADAGAANGQKQAPADVARVNGEKHVVAYLSQLENGGSETAAAAAAAGDADDAAAAAVTTKPAVASS